MPLTGELIISLATTFLELSPNWLFLPGPLLYHFLLKCQTCIVVWSLPFLLWLPLPFYPSQSFPLMSYNLILPWHLLLSGPKLKQIPKMYWYRSWPVRISQSNLPSLLVPFFNPVLLVIQYKPNQLDTWYIFFKLLTSALIPSHNIIPLSQISASITCINNTISPHLYLTWAICALVLLLS